MKIGSSSLSHAFFFLLLGVCFFCPVVRAEDPLLQIQVFPDQNSVKTGMMFLNRVEVSNTSDDTSVDFWSNTCSYEKHWVTDNPVVSIQSWTCNENTLEEVTLDPGNSYEKNIILYIPSQDKTGPVTFRLGFKRMSEDGDVAEPLWSDPITMNVVVPEEAKETPIPPVAEILPETSAQVSVDASKESDTPSSPVPSATPVTENKPLIFRDPGVPVEVLPGEEFSIALASNPSTGFRWKMTMPEGDKTAQFVRSDHVVSQEVMPGVPGEEIFKFKAVTPGEGKIDFVYERPWEPRTAPTRKIFTILVQKN
ncbi:MAG: protease inhibitor I42 family protein [Candidatus Omnitrophota bacterium]